MPEIYGPYRLRSYKTGISRSTGEYHMNYLVTVPPVIARKHDNGTEFEVVEMGRIDEGWLVRPIETPEIKVPDWAKRK